MLAALLPAPLRERSSWGSRDHPTVRGRQLAPGIWVCAERVWVHASALDAHTDLPLAIAEVELYPRNLPFPAWHEWALCAGMPVSTFFGAATDERPTMKRSELASARRVCAACEVKADCLTWSLSPATLEKHGVWGGTSGRQRAEMRKELGAGAVLEVVVKDWFAKWLGT